MKTKKIIVFTLVTTMLIGLITQQKKPFVEASNSLIKSEIPNAVTTNIDFNFNIVNKDEDFNGKQLNIDKANKYLKELKFALSKRIWNRNSSDFRNTPEVHTILSHGIVSASDSKHYIEEAIKLGYNFKQEEADYTYNFLTNKNIMIFKNKKYAVPSWSDMPGTTRFDNALQSGSKYVDNSDYQYKDNINQNIIDKRFKGDEILSHFAKGKILNFDENAFMNISHGIHFPFIGVTKLTISTDFTKINDNLKLDTKLSNTESFEVVSKPQDYILIDNKYLFKLNSDGSLSDLSQFKKQIPAKGNYNRGLKTYTLTNLVNAKNFIDIMYNISVLENKEENSRNEELKLADDAVSQMTYNLDAYSYTLPLDIKYITTSSNSSLLENNTVQENFPERVGNLTNIRKAKDGTVVGDYIFGRRFEILTGTGKKVKLQEGAVDNNSEFNVDVLKNGVKYDTYDFGSWKEGTDQDNSEYYNPNEKYFYKYSKLGENENTDFYIIKSLPVYESDNVTPINYSLNIDDINNNDIKRDMVNSFAYSVSRGKFITGVGTNGDFYNTIPNKDEIAYADYHKEYIDNIPVYVVSNVVTFFEDINTLFIPKAIGVKVSLHELSDNISKELKEDWLNNSEKMNWKAWSYYLSDTELKGNIDFDLYKILPNEKEEKVQTITLNKDNNYSFVIDKIPFQDDNGDFIKYKLKKTSANDGYKYLIFEDIEETETFNKGDLTNDEFSGYDVFAKVEKSKKNKVKAFASFTTKYFAYKYKIVRYKDEPIQEKITPKKVVAPQAVKVVTSSAVTSSSITTPTSVTPSSVKSIPQNSPKTNNKTIKTESKKTIQTPNNTPKNDKIAILNVKNDKVGLGKASITYKRDKNGDLLKIIKYENSELPVIIKVKDKTPTNVKAAKQLPVTGGSNNEFLLGSLFIALAIIIYKKKQ